MNSILSKASEFSSLLQRYFAERLLQQKNASPKTIVAYRDAFRLFLEYTEKHHHTSASTFTLNDFNATLVMGFLDHLELQRKNSIRSRNARLTAIHSFARYVALQCPCALNQAQQILAIPTKRFEKPLIGFLSREEIRAVLDAPDVSRWSGQRDRVLLALLYNTGARVSELIAIRVADLEMGPCPSVRLHGKGRKQRTVPLWKTTATLLRSWVKCQKLQPHQPVLPSRQGTAMTRSNVAERLMLAVTAASTTCPQLIGRHITPHSLRHYSDNRIMPISI